MLIVDAQVDIWAANSPERPWPARHEPHRPAPITLDDLLREMTAAGVDRVILVPPSWEGEHNDLVLAAAQAHPDRFAVMGRLDPEAPQSRAAIRNWRALTEKLFRHVHDAFENAPRGAHERRALDNRRLSRAIGDEIHIDAPGGMFDAEHPA